MYSPMTVVGGDTSPKPPVLESIQTHIKRLKPYAPTRAVICVGEYPIRVLSKWLPSSKVEALDFLPVFVDRLSVDVERWTEKTVDDYSIIGLDPEFPAHFWINVFSNVTRDENFFMRLKDKSLHRLQEALVVSSTWDGVGSGLLPVLVSRFGAWNANTLALVVMPSASQLPDAHFNAVCSLGKSLSGNLAPLVVLGRDALERYVGVGRTGALIQGNEVINEILELIVSKEKAITELMELSKSYNVRHYTILPVMGASLEIYGSLENMLDSVLLRPLLTFDLSSSTLVHVLWRMSTQLKGQLRKDQVELAVANWFGERANLRGLHVSDPTYLSETTDRVDVLLFVGGFSLTQSLDPSIKRIQTIKNYVLEQRLLTKDEWDGIYGSLSGYERFTS